MNVSFKGYNNIVAKCIDFNNGYSTQYIVAQLNDEGYPDLTNYRKLKRMQGLSDAEVENDLLQLVYREYPKHDVLSLGDKELYWGAELLHIEQTLPKFMTRDEYMHERDLHMKAYTLLANITDRMANDNRKVISDDKLPIIFKKTIEHLEKFLNKDVIWASLYSNVPYQKIAANFNQGIKLTMSHFFG